MLEFFNDVNPIILDTVFVAVIVLIAFFGAIKGIKKVLGDFIIAVASFMLAFTSVTTSVKSVLTEKIIMIDKWIPASNNNATLFMASFFSLFVSSVVLFLLFYVVLNVLKYLFRMIISRKRGETYRRKTVIGRIFGGVFSLLYGGIVVIAFIAVLNNNIVGMKGLVEKSTVTNFIIDESEKLINKKDSQGTAKIIVKLYLGDVLVEVDDEMVEAFEYIDDNASRILNVNYQGNINNENLEQEEVKIMIKEYIVLIHKISILSNKFDDYNIQLKGRFFKMSEEFITIMNKKVHDVPLGALDFSVSEYGEIKSDFREAGLSNELIALVDEIVEGK